MLSPYLQRIRRSIVHRADYQLKKYCWKTLHPEWRLRSGLTVRIEGAVEWIIYNDVFVDGEYDFAIQAAIDGARPGRPIRVLDLGGNVGMFATRFADLLFQRGDMNRDFHLTMVEGSPSTFATLEARISEQEAIRSHVRLVNALVGARQGEGNIGESDLHAMNSVFTAASGSTVRVPFVDLECVSDLEGEIDLLKCDIEGSELQFVENYPDLLRRVRVAVIELHDDLCDTRRCRDILGSVFPQRLVLRKERNYSVECFLRTHDDP